MKQLFERELSGVRKHMGDHLAGEIRDLRDKQLALSSELKHRLGDSVETSIETLSSQHRREMNGLEAKVEQLNFEIEGYKSKIQDLKNDLGQKAQRVEVRALINEIVQRDMLGGAVDTIVDQVTKRLPKPLEGPKG